jgi:hypothetical protein
MAQPTVNAEKKGLHFYKFVEQIYQQAKLNWALLCQEKCRNMQQNEEKW